MGQLTNQYVSSSYQGLLKMTDSTTGVTSTLQTVQTGDGTNTPLQISQTEVNISGSLTVNGSPITGSSINTGSFATTGSNNFIGNQTIDGDVDITGSLYSTDIVGTGSLFLQPNQGDPRYLEIYNTSPTDTHITASGGQIFLGDDQTYVKVDNYGSVERIDVVAGNELNVSSSLVNLTGSLHQSGTFYPDVIDWFSSSIVQNTGSYVLTTDALGVTQYDSYQNVASAIQPYLQTGSGVPSGTISGSAQIAAFGYATTSSVNSLSQSIATTDLNQNNVIAGLATTSSLTSLSSSIASTNLGQDNRLGSLESKTGSYATTGSNNFVGQQNINGTVNVTGSLNVTGEITALSASITYLETIYQTSSVIFSSGSNILGDEAGDTQTLWGTVKLPTGPLSVTGSVTATNFTGSLQGTSSYAINALSSSHAINADTASFVNSAVTSSIAFDLVVLGKCDNPGGLTKGTIVRITGANGDNPLFNSASWTNDPTSANTLGMLSENVAYNGFANVVVQGKVIGINTSGMTAGDLLFLSSSGQYTTSSVPAPFHEVRLGQVLRSNLNNGSAYISIDNGYELTELHDVDITSPVNGDLLVYRSGSYGQWVNETGGEIGFATTGSNTFKGTQDISGSLNMNPNSVLTLQTGSSMRLIGDSTGGPANIGFFENSTTTRSFNIQAQPGGNGNVALSDFPTNNHFMFFNMPLHWIQFEAPLTSTGSGNAIDVLYGMNIGMNQTSSAMGLKVTGSLNVTGSQHRLIGSTIITGSLNVTGGITGSLQGTASYATNALTASFALNSAGGGSIDTGSFATTGSNIFRGDQVISGSLIGNSLNNGMIFINSEAYNSGSVKASISASNPGSQSNIFFGGNAGAGAPNQTGSIVISGSNNIFMGGPRPSTIVTAGTYGYIGGNINIMMGQSTLSTSSILRPSMNANIIAGGGNLSMIFTSSSVAGGQPIFSTNIVNANMSANMGASGSISATGNIINGATTLLQTGSAIANARNQFISNNINSSFFVQNYQSSSFTVSNNNTVGASHYIDNNFVNGFGAAGITVNRNFFQGQLNYLNIGGSPSNNTTRVASDSFFGGFNVTGSLLVSGSNNGNLSATLIYGNNLNINGTSAATDRGGNAFFGRFNDTGSLANSNDIIFAVGTGTAVSTRRTGFYITTGSLVGISGSLDVKGNTTITGSVILSGSANPELIVIGETLMTGSLTVTGSAIITGSVQGNVLPLTVSSNTASLNLNNGNFFVLALTGSQDIRIEPSNIKAGQTINIKLNTTGSGTVSFPTSVKQVSGSSYVPTTDVSTDIITMISFDNSNLFLANVKNLV